MCKLLVGGRRMGKAQDLAEELRNAEDGLVLRVVGAKPDVSFLCGPTLAERLGIEGVILVGGRKK